MWDIDNFERHSRISEKELMPQPSLEEYTMRLIAAVENGTADYSILEEGRKMIFNLNNGLGQFH